MFTWKGKHPFCSAFYGASQLIIFQRVPLMVLKQAEILNSIVAKDC
jgi:hypothetical protein